MFTIRHYLIATTFLCCLLSVNTYIKHAGIHNYTSSGEFTLWMTFKEPVIGIRDIDITIKDIFSYETHIR